MAKNEWFKHYNDAHDGQTFIELWADKDFETIAFYWAFLEMISRFEDEENRGVWTGKLSIFKAKLNLNSTRSRKLLNRISTTFEVKLEWNSTESFTVFVPNWLKLQENRGGKREAKKDQKTTDRRSKIEERRNKELRVEEVDRENHQHHQNFSDENLAAEFLGDFSAGSEVRIDQKNGATSTTPAAPNAAKESGSKNGVTTPVQMKTRFEIIEAFRGKSTILDEILIYVSPTTQKSWASRFDAEWLIKTLTNAAEYHISAENAENPSQINDWGRRLVTWVRREKKPILGGSAELTAAQIAQWEAEIVENQKNGEK